MLRAVKIIILLLIININCNTNSSYNQTIQGIVEHVEFSGFNFRVTVTFKDGRIKRFAKYDDTCVFQIGVNNIIVYHNDFFSSYPTIINITKEKRDEC